jgi:glycosyltransferase involved in cell wall biosynthesis
MMASKTQAPIVFIDFLSGLSRWGALAAADFFILPSHQENFGMAVIESLAAGTPVLISKEVNTWKRIIENKAGLADTDDFDGTHRLIKLALEMPQETLSTFKANAKDCFQKNFDLNYAPETLHKLIASDLSTPSSFRN